VAVDESRSERQPVEVDDLVTGTFARFGDGGDVFAVDDDISTAARLAGSVDDPCVAKHSAHVAS
jgi:hypothetical protein